MSTEVGVQTTASTQKGFHAWKIVKKLYINNELSL